MSTRRGPSVDRPVFRHWYGVAQRRGRARPTAAGTKARIVTPDSFGGPAGEWQGSGGGIADRGSCQAPPSFPDGRFSSAMAGREPPSRRCGPVAPRSSFRGPPTSRSTERWSPNLAGAASCRGRASTRPCSPPRWPRWSGGSLQHWPNTGSRLASGRTRSWRTGPTPRSPHVTTWPDAPPCSPERFRGARPRPVDPGGGRA